MLYVQCCLVLSGAANMDGKMRAVLSDATKLDSSLSRDPKEIRRSFLNHLCERAARRVKIGTKRLMTLHSSIKN